ncbi:hypothetical protein ACFV9E_36800 [Streptomyces sp. NPDC059835]|uniref:hypothetical protein n=1 Tax=Streptomyces sp. NPDC059835 TaxID=3346967 RepID=UPI0036487112
MARDTEVLMDVRRNHHGRIGVATVVLWLMALVAAVSGCGLTDGPPQIADVTEVQRPELIGAWSDAQDGGVTLNDDGTFSATKLKGKPVEGAGVKMLGEDLMEGSGKWESSDAGSGPRVDLMFSGGGTLAFRVKAQDGAKVLTNRIGDVGTSVLKKKSAPKS